MSRNRASRLLVAGVPLRAPRSWVVLVAILTGITVNALEPADHRPAWYAAAALTIVGVIVSLLAHDAAHAAVARRTSGVLRSINPPLFGALSDDVYPPESPAAEVRVAAAGPLLSLALTLVAGAGWLFVLDRDGLAAGAAGFIALANLAILTGSLLPGFPFDGGRIFRAFVWYLTGDLIRGTRAAAFYGQALAISGMIAAVFMLSLGEPFAVWGAWLILACWTINRAGSEGFTRTLWRETSRQVTIEDAGLANSRRLAAHRTLDETIDELLHGVVEGPMLVATDGEVSGVVSLNLVRRIPRAIWTERTLGDVSIPLDGMPRVAATAPMLDLLDLFDATRTELALIERNGRISGVVDQQITADRIRQRIRADRFRPQRTRPR